MKYLKTHCGRTITGTLRGHLNKEIAWEKTLAKLSRFLTLWKTRIYLHNIVACRFKRSYLEIMVLCYYQVNTLKDLSDVSICINKTESINLLLSVKLVTHSSTYSLSQSCVNKFYLKN